MGKKVQLSKTANKPQTKTSITKIDKKIIKD